MKISKLFHWLYAFLMFLPIVLFIPNAFYYGFNEHATNTETTTINYKYQSNEVNTLDDLVPNNIYEIDNFFFADDIFPTYNAFTMYIHYLGSIEDYTVDSTYADINSLQELNSMLLVNERDNGEGFYLLTIYLDQEIENSSISQWYYAFESHHMIISFEDNLQINEFKKFYNDTYLIYHDGEISMPHYTDYNVIESVENNTDDTISNKMYQAWQSTWNLPLLQWTHSSFVAQPFTYITGLFGVPSDSTLNYIFAYFVSISICWLVFDLIMYVPNLAHRWLDRSALE